MQQSVRIYAKSEATGSILIDAHLLNGISNRLVNTGQEIDSGMRVCHQKNGSVKDECLKTRPCNWYWELQINNKYSLSKD